MLTAMLLLLSSAPPARPAEIAAARQLAREGFRLADAGKCAAAVDPLTRADSLFHAPTILLRLAECHLTLGKLVLGTEELRRVVVEDPGPNPSRAFVAARERAKNLLAAAEPRLGHMILRVSGPEVKALSLHLDADPLAAGMVGIDVVVDPGPHQVRAEAEGFLSVEATFSVAAGASEKVDLVLEPAPARAAQRAEPTEPGTVPPPELPVAQPRLAMPATAGSARSFAPAFVTLGVGLAGLGVGIGFGVAALGDRSRLDSTCEAKQCPPSARADVAALQRDSTVSTIGWAVGGVCVAASVVLFLVAGARSERVSWLTPTGTGLVVRW